MYEAKPRLGKNNREGALIALTDASRTRAARLTTVRIKNNRSPYDIEAGYFFFSVRNFTISDRTAKIIVIIS